MGSTLGKIGPEVNQMGRQLGLLIYITITILINVVWGETDDFSFY